VDQYSNGRTAKGGQRAATPAKRVDIVTLRLVRESSFLYGQRRIKSPSDAAAMMREFLEDADREHLCVVCLDTKHQPTAVHTASVGTLNATAVHPREIFKVAVLSNSAAVILVHNHPSGRPEPSHQDLEVTRRVSRAGEILGIEVLDHVIIGSGGRYVSLKERGLMGGGEIGD